MKRLLAASALVASLAATASAALASVTLTGGAQIQWTSAATASLAIVTQYSGTFTQGAALPTLLPSAAGVCTAAGTEAAFTLTFGALTPSTSVPTACLYKNALGVSVQTNDASGFAVNEYLDATPTSGIGICSYPNGGASFPLAPALAITTSTRTGNPAAGSYAGMALTSCAATGGIVPPGTGGTSSLGTTPGNPGTGGLEYYAPSGAGLSFMTSASPTVNAGAMATMYGGQDIQVNLAPGAKSTLAGQTGAYLTVQLVLN